MATRPISLNDQTATVALAGHSAGGPTVPTNRPHNQSTPSLGNRPDGLIRLVRLLAREAAAAEVRRRYGFSIWEIAPVVAAIGLVMWVLQFMLASR